MRSSATRRSDFSARAADYDRLRPELPHVDDLVIRYGDLRGRRVLDVGCGTGRFADVLEAGEHAKVWGVDREPRMIDVAKARGSRATFRVAEAERLPFKDGWFERVTMLRVLQHLDRPRALAEAHRVLADDGRLVCLTFDPDYFHLGVLVRWFPGMLEPDRARFPTETALRDDLSVANFVNIVVHRESRRAQIPREPLLESFRARQLSTFDLISDAEYEAGLARAERELPEFSDAETMLLIVVAER